MLRPGQVHQLELKAGSTGYLMEFDQAFYHPADSLPKQRLIRAGQKNVCAVEDGRFEKLLAILTNIFNEFSGKQEGYVEVIKASLDIFFIEFLRQSRNPASHQGSLWVRANRRRDERSRALDTQINGTI